MTKRKTPDIDSGLEAERLPDPERAPKDTDREWPLPPPPVERPEGLLSSHAIREADGILEGLSPAARVQAMVEHDKAVSAPEPSPAETLLLALEQRCMNGGSAGLDDIRAVLAKLRGG